MYKKLLYVILTILTVTCFAACNTASSEDNDSTSDISSEYEDDVTEPDDDASSDSDIATDEDEPDNNNESDSSTEIKLGNIIKNTDPVIIDNELFTFKILSADFEYSDHTGNYELSIECTNKTDHRLDFEFYDAYINHVYYNPGWFSLVESGETTTRTASFREEYLNQLGITDVGNITFWLKVNSDGEVVYDNLHAYYPSGEEGDITYTYTYEPDDVILYNKNGITFSVTECSQEDDGSFSLEVYLENNTDKHYEFQTDDTAMNGLVSENAQDDMLLSGTKAHLTYYFPSENMKQENISLPITDLTFTLSLTDYNSSEPESEEIVTYYPLGKDASNPYKHDLSDTDVVLADTQGCRMIVTDFSTETLDFGGIYYNVILFCENTSDTTVSYRFFSSNVNGKEVFAHLSKELAPNQKGFFTIPFSASSLEELGITEIETIEFPLKITNEDYDTIFEENVTFSPQ